MQTDKVKKSQTNQMRCLYLPHLNLAFGPDKNLRCHYISIYTFPEQNISDLQKAHFYINPPMVQPFRLIYLANRGGVATLPLEILTIACLTFCLLLTDRPTLGLPEYKLKVVNICKKHGTGGLEVVVL